MNRYLTLTPFKRLLRLLQVDKQEIFSIYVFALFSGIVALSLPLGIQAIINLIVGGQVSTSWIILVVLVIAGVALTGVMQIMQLIISENLQQKIFTRSAFEIAFRVPRLKTEAVEKSYIPELVNRFFDTLSIQKGLSKILMDFSSASLQVIFGLILLSLYHPFFIFFSMILVLTVFLIFRFTVPQGLRTSLQESQKKYEVAHWLEELARTMETFKLAGKSPLPMQKTDEVVEGYLKSRKIHFKTLLVQYINLVGFKVVIAAGLLVIGGLLVINQQMNIGQFVASEIIIILVLASIEKLIVSIETIYDVLTALEKLGTITDIPLDRDKGMIVELGEEEMLSVHLNNITFRFDDAKEDTLKDIQLMIDSGDKVCLSGFDGSGKSQLLQIIAGLYTDYSGSVSYNNIPLGNWCTLDLRAMLGYNLTRDDIFKGTLLENITLGKEEVSVKDVKNFLPVIGLEEFIESLPAGFDTELIPEGKNLPRSIRLKIMLTRSVLGNPRFIMLEESFNLLNDADKDRFLDYLLSLKTTVIAVSNDPRVAERFDKVAVLEKGRLLAYDPLQKLKSKKWYSSVFQKR